MKYILLLIAIASFGFTYDRDIKTLLCDKKWVLSFMQSGDRLISVTEELEERKVSVYFSKGGEFRNSIDGEEGNGTWQYDEKTKSVTTIEEGSGISTTLKLLKLTKDSLELLGPDKMMVGFVSGR